MSVIQKHNWVNPDIVYIRDGYVDEWDIHAAGFSALKETQIITAQQIAELEKLPKVDRNIKIGLLQREHPQMGAQILETIANIREQFYTANNLLDAKILSIKKDAIIVVDSKITVTKFGQHFEFVNKGHFTSYLRLGNYEFYYNSMTNQLVCKGLGNDYDQISILTLIKQILQTCETTDKEGRLKYLQKIQRQYLNHELPVHVYKDPRTGQYTVAEFDFTTPDASAFQVNQLDIATNYVDFLLPTLKAVI